MQCPPQLQRSTGYGRFWPDLKTYLGTDERGAEAKLHFPGLHPEAVQWLVQNRKIDAIGLDTPSIDYGQSETYESHRILFEANIPAFENVANLDQLSVTGATVIALPMKIEGGSAEGRCALSPSCRKLRCYRAKRQNAITPLAPALHNTLMAFGRTADEFNKALPI